MNGPVHIDKVVSKIAHIVAMLYNYNNFVSLCTNHLIVLTNYNKNNNVHNSDLCGTPSKTYFQFEPF